MYLLQTVYLSTYYNDDLFQFHLILYKLLIYNSIIPLINLFLSYI